MNRPRTLLSTALLLPFIVASVFAVRYSDNRSALIAELKACMEKQDHPAQMLAPDGSIGFVSSVRLCPIVPPSLWNLVRGRMVFEGVPEHMQVKPYSMTDVLRGHYTFGLHISLPCDQSATTTDCASLTPSLQTNPNPTREDTSKASTSNTWYAHVVSGYDGPETVWTNTPELPKADPKNNGYGEHITVIERESSLTPLQYIEKYVSVRGTPTQFSAWSTHFGRKQFTIGFTDPNDGSIQQSTYLFGGGHIVLVNIHPDKQDNRAEFQTLINAAAQTLPMISREETTTACATITLPPGQEYDILSDPETGYVTIGYWTNSEPGTGTPETYTFLNFNDDLNRCSPSIGNILSLIKQSAQKSGGPQ